MQTCFLSVVPKYYSFIPLSRYVFSTLILVFSSLFLRGNLNIYIKHFLHFTFRLRAAEFIVFAGVLNRIAESSEDTKVVREVTEVFLHEKFDYDSLINDIAIIKVGIIFKYKNQHFISFEHISHKVHLEV